MVSPTAAVYAAAAFLAVAVALSGIPGAAEASPSFAFPQTQNRAENDGKSGETCPPTFLRDFPRPPPVPRSFAKKTFYRKGPHIYM